MHNFFFDDLPVTEPYSVYKTPPKKDRSYKFFTITGNNLAPETMWKHNICRKKTSAIYSFPEKRWKKK